jgi:uncharacterized protein YkwD
MRTTSKIAVAALILMSSTTTALAQDGSTRTWGGRFFDHTHSAIGAGLRRILHHESAAVPAASMAAASPQVASPQGGGDPYGFAVVLNRLRAASGLHPLSYDPGLSAWAARNNAAQVWRGIGHHVNPNCRQNCAWNVADANEAAQSWMESPGHRENMLARDVTSFGIAFGPGPYWTLNTR